MIILIWCLWYDTFDIWCPLYNYDTFDTMHFSLSVACTRYLAIDMIWYFRRMMWYFRHLIFYDISGILYILGIYRTWYDNIIMLQGRHPTPPHRSTNSSSGKTTNKKTQNNTRGIICIGERNKEAGSLEEMQINFRETCRVQNWDKTDRHNSITERLKYERNRQNANIKRDSVRWR